MNLFRRRGRKWLSKKWWRLSNWLLYLWIQNTVPDRNGVNSRTWQFQLDYSNSQINTRFIYNSGTRCSKYSPWIASFSPLATTFRWILPLRSVWSIPHSLAVFFSHRLCTFMSHAAIRKTIKCTQPLNISFMVFYNTSIILLHMPARDLFLTVLHGSNC